MFFSGEMAHKNIKECHALTGNTHFNLLGDSHSRHSTGEGVLGTAVVEPFLAYCKALDCQDAS